MGEKKGKGLRKRITLAMLLGMSIILFSYAAVGYVIVHRSIKDSLNNQLSLARLIRNSIDHILEENVARLQDVSASTPVNFFADDPAQGKNALKVAYRYSIFRDGVFLLDREGNVVLKYPERMHESALNLLSLEPVRRMAALGKPLVSDIYTVQPSQRKVLFVLVPFKDGKGKTVGTLGGEIDPTDPLLTRLLRLIDAGKNTFVDVIDSNGVVIASSDPARTFHSGDHNRFLQRVIAARKESVGMCHSCHEPGAKKEKSRNTMIFVPLDAAPWGISIQQPEDEVFAPAMRLKRTFIILGLIFTSTALLLTIAITRSIVNPINELIRATERISRGEMSEPVASKGDDEIGFLSRGFESMRKKLVESLDSIKRHNAELESRVRERTLEIKESRKRIAKLLKKVITTQEDERKRIARELHDETIQDLSAILMRVDMCKLIPESITGDKIEEIRNIVLKSLDGAVAISQNLRPSVLDDLGLEAAVKWLLETHLGERGIEYYYSMTGAQKMRFRPEVEITLFRIIQEAIANAARHAKARHVFVLVKTDRGEVKVRIEDDGTGFDYESVLHDAHDVNDSRGLGLAGMMERASLIGGKLEICSVPGGGTTVGVRFPLESPGEENV